MTETSNGHSSQEETVDFSGKGMKLDTEDAGMYLLVLNKQIFSDE